MATSPVSRVSQEFRENACKLFEEYFQGMQSLLLRPDFNPKDQEDLRRTLAIMQSVTKSFLETAQGAEKLTSSQRERQLLFVKSAGETISSLRQKKIDQARQEFNILKEQAEFLQKRISNSQKTTNASPSSGCGDQAGQELNTSKKQGGSSQFSNPQKIEPGSSLDDGPCMSCLIS